ncbi:hypothetical protein [Jiella avicenniae]|uniref:Uncharacterized protein n=1 Tax=Jiella avicenniae TaxID=2907202 RepID=A0A9X1T780_9HYPH|nr:hypothetical protein [Jiella avicenniae]MCE7030115.1 hypothetical protein [Jiella avicenniae]
MTKSPETRGPAIADLSQRHNALLVLDVDEVVLQFITPFCELLEDHGAKLHAESFRLTGNVREIATGAALSGHRLDDITEQLYREQEARQRPVDCAQETLGGFADLADIVFLTAMTPSHYERRRRTLDRSGLLYPMIATERSKGAVVAELCERWDGPVVFVDDLPPNLAAVRRSAPQVRLLHFMANDVFRPHLPPLPQGAESATDWPTAAAKIRTWLES